MDYKEDEPEREEGPLPETSSTPVNPCSTHFKEPQLCPCGCGQPVGKRKNQIYASALCRSRVKNRKRWKTVQEARRLALLVLDLTGPSRKPSPVWGKDIKKGQGDIEGSQPSIPPAGEEKNA